MTPDTSQPDEFCLCCKQPGPEHCDYGECCGCDDPDCADCHPAVVAGRGTPDGDTQ